MKWLLTVETPSVCIIVLFILKVTDKIPGSGAGVGSDNQRYGSADPDPYKNSAKKYNPIFYPFIYGKSS
jgi:hypothetical protein